MNFDAIMRAIAAAPGAANNQANVLEDQAQAARMQGLSAPLPQNVQPAFRTPDAIGLLLGALLSNGNNDSFGKFVAGFQQAKQGKAAQDTQRNQQQYQLGQAQNELRATGFERKAANARKAGASLTAGMQSAADDAESRRRFNLTYDRGVQKDRFSAETALKKLEQGGYATMAKLAPSARRQYAITVLGLSEADADVFADMTPDELVKRANAGLADAKTTTETTMLKPKVDAIVAGTENKKASTADINSRREERAKLLPGKLNAQMRADALKASQIKMNDARIVKINADIQAQAKRVENSWRNVTSQIEARTRTGGGGKVAGVTPTARYNAYDRELVAIRKQRDRLIESRRKYNAELQLGDPKLKAFYETAIEDVDKLITDLGVAGAAAAKKRDAVLAPVAPVRVPSPFGPVGSGKETGGVEVEKIKGKEAAVTAAPKGGGNLPKRKLNIVDGKIKSKGVEYKIRVKG